MIDNPKGEDFLPSQEVAKIAARVGRDAIDSEFEGPRNAAARVILQTANELVWKAHSHLKGGKEPQPKVCKELEAIIESLDKAIAKSEREDRSNP